MGTLKVKFGRRLSHLRNEKNMTQEGLAEAAGVSIDLINKIERGIHAPSFKSLEKLANSLNVPVKELFNFTE